MAYSDNKHLLGGKNVPKTRSLLFLLFYCQLGLIKNIALPGFIVFTFCQPMPQKLSEMVTLQIRNV